jgi:hypothetical protein
MDRVEAVEQAEDGLFKNRERMDDVSRSFLIGLVSSSALLIRGNVWMVEYASKM